MGENSFFLVVAFILAFSAQALAQDKGEKLYLEHCGTCHQIDGGGVPFMQPGLIASPRANGLPGAEGGVIEMILVGSAAIPIGTSEFQNEMPGFSELSNEEITQIANYVRSNFTNTGSAVTVGDVKRTRVRLFGK